MLLQNEYSYCPSVYGAGATSFSVPVLQYCLISLKRYLFLSSLKPSGLICRGRTPCCAKFKGFCSNEKDCSGEKLFSLTDFSRFIFGEAEVVVLLNVRQFLEVSTEK